MSGKNKWYQATVVFLVGEGMTQELVLDVVAPSMQSATRRIHLAYASESDKKRIERGELPEDSTVIVTGLYFQGTEDDYKRVNKVELSPESGDTLG